MKPMLCKDNLERFLEKHKDRKIMHSPKLDGVRCLTCVEASGSVRYWSRSGKEFNNFNVFDESMRAMAKQLNRSTVWFDGEVTADNFSHVMTQLRRHKEIDPSIFEMHLFDIDIANAAPFIERYRMLEQVLYYPPNNVVLVNHGILKHNDHHHCEGVMKFYIHEGYEGTVLKVFDSPYTGKKSDFWCKMKPWHTVDMLVQEVIPGKGKHEGRMGALLCEGEGYTAKVGTGFTDAERESFLVTPPTMIEVKYQEVTKDKSLRFPSFVRVREDK